MIYTNVTTEESASNGEEAMRISFPTARPDKAQVPIGSVRCKLNFNSSVEIDLSAVGVDLQITPLLMSIQGGCDDRLLRLQGNWNGRIDDHPIEKNSTALRASFIISAQNKYPLDSIRRFMIAVGRLYAPGAIVLDNAVNNRRRLVLREEPELAERPLPILFPKSHRRHAFKMISQQLAASIACKIAG